MLLLVHTEFLIWQALHGEGNGNPLQYSCLENPWTEEPGRLESMGSHRVRHDLVTEPPPPLGKWLCWSSPCSSTHAHWLLFRHGQDWGWGGKKRSRDGIGKLLLCWCLAPSLVFVSDSFVQC